MLNLRLSTRLLKRTKICGGIKVCFFESLPTTSPDAIACIFMCWDDSSCRMEGKWKCLFPLYGCNSEMSGVLK